MPPFSATSVRPVGNGAVSPLEGSTTDCTMLASGCATPARQVWAPIVFFVTYYAIGPALRPGGTGALATKMPRRFVPHHVERQSLEGPVLAAPSSSSLSLPEGLTTPGLPRQHSGTSPTPSPVRAPQGRVDPPHMDPFLHGQVGHSDGPEQSQLGSGRSVSSTRQSMRIHTSSVGRREPVLAPTDILLASRVENGILPTRVQDWPVGKPPGPGYLTLDEPDRVDSLSWDHNEIYTHVGLQPSNGLYTFTATSSAFQSEGTTFIPHSTATPMLVATDSSIPQATISTQPVSSAEGLGSLEITGRRTSAHSDILYVETDGSFASHKKSPSDEVPLGAPGSQVSTPILHVTEPLLPAGHSFSSGYPVSSSNRLSHSVFQTSEALSTRASVMHDLADSSTPVHHQLIGSVEQFPRLGSIPSGQSALGEDPMLYQPEGESDIVGAVSKLLNVHVHAPVLVPSPSLISLSVSSTMYHISPTSTTIAVDLQSSSESEIEIPGAEGRMLPKLHTLAPVLVPSSSLTSLPTSSTIDEMSPSSTTVGVEFRTTEGNIEIPGTYGSLLPSGHTLAPVLVPSSSLTSRPTSSTIDHISLSSTTMGDELKSSKNGEIEIPGIYGNMLPSVRTLPPVLVSSSSLTSLPTSSTIDHISPSSTTMGDELKSSKIGEIEIPAMYGSLLPSVHTLTPVLVPSSSLTLLPTSSTITKMSPSSTTVDLQSSKVSEIEISGIYESLLPKETTQAPVLVPTSSLTSQPTVDYTPASSTSSFELQSSVSASSPSQQYSEYLSPTESVTHAGTTGSTVSVWMTSKDTSPPEKEQSPTPDRDNDEKRRTSGTKPGKGGIYSTVYKYTPTPWPSWSKRPSEVFTKPTKGHPPRTTAPRTTQQETTAAVRRTTVRPSSELPPLRIMIELRMAFTDFCRNYENFRLILTTILYKKLHPNKQFRPEIRPDCQDHEDNNVGRRSVEIIVMVYIADRDGIYNWIMTDRFATILDKYPLDEYPHPFKDKVVEIRVIRKKRSPPHTEHNPATGAGLSRGVVAGIGVAAIVGTCIVIFVAFQMTMLARGRSTKKMRVVMDDGARSSIDVHSMEESIQMASVANMCTKFGYVNRGLDTEDKKDYTSNPVTLGGLCKLLDNKNTEELEDEFLMLPNSMPRLCEVPVGAEDKNRYANVMPIPKTRVPLVGRPEDHSTNYINANYVRGYGGRSRAYIATQAPMENTRADFWHMVWTQQSQVIIMITGMEEHGQAKCAEYWPNTEGSDIVRIYGDYNVQLKGREVYTDWTVSALALKNMETNLTREVHHFWLTAWPQHGVPDHPAVVLRLLTAVRPFMMDSHGPTVIHCSPGTGRTGTVLAIHLCTTSFDLTRMVDVPQCVCQLREDRGGAVQTKEQYIFLYRALLEHAMRITNPSILSRAYFSPSVTSYT